MSGRDAAFSLVAVGLLLLVSSTCDSSIARVAELVAEGDGELVFMLKELINNNFRIFNCPRSQREKIRDRDLAHLLYPQVREILTVM